MIELYNFQKWPLKSQCVLQWEKFWVKLQMPPPPSPPPPPLDGGITGLVGVRAAKGHETPIMMRVYEGLAPHLFPGSEQEVKIDTPLI